MPKSKTPTPKTPTKRKPTARDPHPPWERLFGLLKEEGRMTRDLLVARMDKIDGKFDDLVDFVKTAIGDVERRMTAAENLGHNGAAH